MATSKEHIVYIAGAHGERFKMMHSVVREACRNVEQALSRPVRLWMDDVPPLLRFADMFEGVRRADIVVADLSQTHPHLMLELGIRLALEKPFILVSDEAVDLPFDLSAFFRLIYDREGGGRALVAQLSQRFEEILRHPEAWEVPWRNLDDPETKRSSVFVSYSHADVEYLSRLRIHLRPLEKAQLIELWDDTRIKSGDRWKEAIAAALERAVVAILMVSADFLASDFIVDNELPPLLRAAEERGTVILPFIVKPSRFLRDPNLSQFQAINDPAQPLAMLPWPQQEALYARLAERIEAMVGA